MHYLFLIVLLLCPFLLTANTANAPISFGVQPIHEIAIQNVSAPFVLSNSHMQSVTTSKGTYAITTNGEEKKIIGSIQFPLPEGTFLSVLLEAPLGASSKGKVLLSANSAVLVSGISRTAQKNLSITYIYTSNPPVLAGTYNTTLHLTFTD